MQKVKKSTLYAMTCIVVFLCLIIFRSNHSIEPVMQKINKKTAIHLPTKTKRPQHLQTKQNRGLPNTLLPANYASNNPTQPVITLHESNASHSSLSFELPSFSVQKVTTPAGNHYLQIISSHGAKNLNKKGYPTLPRYKQQLLVPKDCSIELVVENTNYTTHTIETLLPGSGPISRTQEIPEVECGEFYNSTESYPSAPIVISSSFNFRNMRAITVTINPFIFDAANQELRVYDQLDFQIKTPGGKILLDTPPTVADFQTRAENTFINYPQATTEYTAVTTRALPEPELGNILIVYASQFKDSLSDFVRWKKQIGFQVETAEYPRETGTGVQALKTFIDQRPEVSHIILIGDAQDIPARVYNWEFTDFTDDYGSDSSFSSPATRTHYTDRYYAGVSPGMNKEEGDLIADKFISRISSSDVATVENQLTRIINYESGTYLSTDSHWLENVLMVASAAGENVAPFDQTDYEHLNDIANNLIPNSHFSQTDKLYADDQNPATPLATKDGVTQELEVGKGLTYYLGHGYNYKWVTSGFDSTAARNLSTNHKPSLVIEPVCNNGLFFSGTQCLAENQMQGDAIGVLASPSETFWNPPVLLLEGITNSIIADQYQTVGGIISSGISDAVLWSTENENSYENKATAVQMLYFGDCSMAMRTMVPQKLTMTVPERVDTSVQSLFISATPGSKISLLHGDTIIDSATSDLNGNVTLNLNNTNFESYTFTAWKRNSLALKRQTAYIVLAAPTTGSDALIDLNALLNGSVQISGDSIFEIIEGKLYYKESAIRSNEDSAFISWTPEAGDSKQIEIRVIPTESSESTYSLNLKPGWNLVGSPVESQQPLAWTSVATETEPAVDLLIWEFDQSNGNYYRPAQSEKLSEQHAFWIFSPTDSTTQPFSGSSQKGIMTSLSLGWNLYSPVKEMPSPLGASSIWSWDTSIKNYKQLSPTEKLTPLTGYWIFMNP